MPNRPIPITEANNMIKAYSTYMTNLGVDMKKQTQSVSFKLTELISWLGKMTEVADEIRICMGDYPDGHPQAGRTTVMLWPYKNGQPSVYTGVEPTADNPEGGGNDDGTDTGDPDPGPGKGVDPFNDGVILP
jgi:hypothetical protein